MNVDKQQILDFRRRRGKGDQAQQADSELPHQVDTDQRAGVLEKFGVDIRRLLGGAAGGIADRLGV